MNDDERRRLAAAVTTAGWLVFATYTLVIIGQFRRAMAIRTASFEDGVWGQRAETVSFVALPQQLVVLVPAAVAGVVAVLLARGGGAPPVAWSVQLVRITAGTCYVVVALAALGIVDVLAQSPDWVGGFVNILLRLGGILMALAMIRVCLECERMTLR